MGWVQKYSPTVRMKGVNVGQRGKVRGFGGVSSAFVGAVAVDYTAKTYIIWDENNPQGLTLPWLDSNPDDFDAFVHLMNGEMRLKIWVAQWRGDGVQQELALYDTGRVYLPNLAVLNHPALSWSVRLKNRLLEKIHVGGKKSVVV